MASKLKQMRKKGKMKECHVKMEEKLYNCHTLLQDRMYQYSKYFPQKLLRQKLSNTSSLYFGELKAHFGCVNAIEFSNKGGYMIASGGDDRRVLLWNTEKALWKKGSPACMKSEHRSNIFCLAFDKDNDKIFSGGNDEQVFVHDAATGNPVDNFMHEDAVYCLSTDPNNCHVFASACDDGRVLIYDIREPVDSDPFCLANYVSSMHSVMFNPVEPRLIATANTKEGVGLWDVRKPRSCLLRYGGEYEQQSCMSVRINSLGTQILALRRRLPPVIYNIHSSKPVVEFDHEGYFNSCTMKSCSFAGDRDQYVLSGSDDFNVYMWKVPQDLSSRKYVCNAHLVLKGHRSIVNQVRYNINNSLIISSGVEKTIKAWSPFRIRTDVTENTDDRQQEINERAVYTLEEYVNLVLRTGQVMAHDYTEQSTEEDPRMMAFFDSLVQREMETWSSSDELSSNEEELYDRILQMSRDGPSLENSEVMEEIDSDNSTSPFSQAFARVMASQDEVQVPRSRLLSIEDSSDSENNESNTPTNDANNRRSISDIIAENKKEIMMKNMATRKKVLASQTKQPCVKRRITSDTESDEEGAQEFSEKCPRVEVEEGECSTGNTSHVNSSSNSSLVSKHKVKNHLRKLRDLRNQVENGDSDSDTNISNNSQSNGQISKCDNSSVAKSSGKTSLNAHEKTQIEESDNIDKCDSLESCNNSSDSVPVNSVISIHNSAESNSDKKTTNYTSDKSASCSTKCEDTPNTSEETVDKANGDLSNDTEINHTRASTSSDNSNIKTNNHDPTWKEFKRYKRTFVRAQRYYRRKSGSQPSSDEDV